MDIPRQLPEGIVAEEIEEQMITTKNALGSFLVIQLILQIYMKGNYIAMLRFLYVIQYVTYLYLLDIGYPATVDMFLEQCKSLSEFDMIKLEKIYEFVAKLVQKDSEKKEDAVEEEDKVPRLVKLTVMLVIVLVVGIIVAKVVSCFKTQL